MILLQPALGRPRRASLGRLCWRRDRFRAAGKALTVDLAPKALRASGVGWYGTAVGLSGLLASLVAGLLWDHVSHPAAFLYGAAFAVAGVAALLLLVQPDGRAPQSA